MGALQTERANRVGNWWRKAKGSDSFESLPFVFAAVSSYELFADFSVALWRALPAEVTVMVMVAGAEGLPFWSMAT